MYLFCMLGQTANLNRSINQGLDVVVDLGLVEVVWATHTMLVDSVVMLPVVVHLSPIRDVHQTLMLKAGHQDGTHQERRIHMSMEGKRLLGMQVRERLILMLMVVKHRHGMLALGHRIPIIVGVALLAGEVRLPEGMLLLQEVLHGVVLHPEGRMPGGVRLMGGHRQRILVGERPNRHLG